MSTPKASTRRPEHHVVLEANGLWGWRKWPPPIPRLHVASYCSGGKMIVWLEREGVRCVEPFRGVPVPTDTMERIAYRVAHERSDIERYWVSDMLEWNWLTVEHTGMCWAVRVYPGTDSERVVPLSTIDGNVHRFDAIKSAALHDQPPSVVVTTSDGEFEQRFLADLLFRGAR